MNISSVFPFFPPSSFPLSLTPFFPSADPLQYSLCADNKAVDISLPVPLDEGKPLHYAICPRGDVDAFTRSTGKLELPSMPPVPPSEMFLTFPAPPSPIPLDEWDPIPLPRVPPEPDFSEKVAQVPEAPPLPQWLRDPPAPLKEGEKAEWYIERVQQLKVSLTLAFSMATMTCSFFLPPITNIYVDKQIDS